jgi:anti-sigma factor RsiW
MKMGECQDFERLMQKSLDMEISQGEMALLDRHITICPDCARELNALKLGLDILASMPAPDPAAGFASETAEKAFKAKKLLAHRQKVMAWSLSGLTVMISILILASWIMIFQPALKWTAFNFLRALSASDVIFNALNKLLSGLTAILIPMGEKALHALWQGAAPALYGYLIALMILLFFILIKKDKVHSPLHLERR